MTPPEQLLQWRYVRFFDSYHPLRLLEGAHFKFFAFKWIFEHPTVQGRKFFRFSRENRTEIRFNHRSLKTSSGIKK